jgi:hypothetical protein
MVSVNYVINTSLLKGIHTSVPLRGRSKWVKVPISYTDLGEGL